MTVLSALLGLGFNSPSKDEIPFRQHGHLIVVEGFIGQSRPLKFVIDTGASRSAIDARVARRLGLAPGETKRVSSLSGRMPLREVTIPDLRIGANRFRNVEAWVGEMPRFERLRFDGLIGLSLLRRTGISLDFESGLLRFASAGSPKASRARLFDRRSVLLIGADIQGKPIRLMLDTGAGETILFKPHRRRGIALSRLRGTKTIRTAQGTARLSRIRLFDVTLGSASWQRFPAFLMDRPDPRYGALDGVLGLPSLSPRRLDLDLRNGWLSWE